MGRGQRPVLDESGKKKCPVCGIHKELELFPPSAKKAFGVDSYCRDCRRERYLIQNYGMSIEQYNALLAEQSGVCAICQQPETHKLKGEITYLQVDYSDGVIHGLLCYACHQALMLLEAKPERIKALMFYVTRRKH